MFKKIKGTLLSITTNPYLNLTAGLILFTTAGYEIFISIEEFELGAHHGLFVYSIVHMLKVVPEIMHGIDDVEKAENAL